MATTAIAIGRNATIIDPPQIVTATATTVTTAPSAPPRRREAPLTSIQSTEATLASGRDGAITATRAWSSRPSLASRLKRSRLGMVVWSLLGCTSLRRRHAHHQLLRTTIPRRGTSVGEITIITSERAATVIGGVRRTAARGTRRRTTRERSATETTPTHRTTHRRYDPHPTLQLRRAAAAQSRRARRRRRACRRRCSMFSSTTCRREPRRTRRSGSWPS